MYFIIVYHFTQRKSIDFSDKYFKLKKAVSLPKEMKQFFYFFLWNLRFNFIR